MKINLLVFVVIFAMEIYGVHKEKIKLRYFSKPLIMPLITLFYLMNAGTVSPLLLLAFAGGWLGDIFLLFDGTREFIMGLLFFLTGHILYIFVFIGLNDNFSAAALQYRIFIIPCFFYLIAAYYVLKTKAGILLWPSLLYVLVLLIMVFTAGLSFFEWGFSLSFWTLLCGAMMFLLSDSLLGIKQFTTRIKKNSTLVMQTYMTAQALIAFSLASAV